MLEVLQGIGPLLVSEREGGGREACPLGQQSLTWGSLSQGQKEKVSGEMKHNCFNLIYDLFPDLLITSCEESAEVARLG